MKTEQENAVKILLPLRVDDAGNENVKEDYHTLSAGPDYHDGRGGIHLSGCMSTKQANYIATACNNHEELKAELWNTLATFRECIGNAAFSDFEQRNPAIMRALALLAKLQFTP